MKRLVLSLVVTAIATSAAVAGQQVDVRSEAQSALKASGVYSKCQQMVLDKDSQSVMAVVENEELNDKAKRMLLRRHAKNVCGYHFQ